MSSKRTYLKAADELHRNPAQWAAYNSTGHCVVLAGPGSGKTKTLTVKLARILAEDVDEPRGVACITYNNECARELERRLDNLGVEHGARVFIGTVHSFSLAKIILPYAKMLDLEIPEAFRIATQLEQRGALERAFARVIGGPENPNTVWRLPMDRYRRSRLNRNAEEWNEDVQLARLVEAYEEELRAENLIDFDDMPLLAFRGLSLYPWLRQAILAKYPVLIVDEYQDLGRALHTMVTTLCFQTGIRLFAVGDMDQSIYGFTGANPNMLLELSERQDVETIRLRFNYRCGSKIVDASKYALGEDRDYEAPEDSEEGTVYFHQLAAPYENQAERLFSVVLPQALQRNPDIKLGQVAILYPAAWIGDALIEAAERHGYEVLRTDGKALYPRSSRLMRWLEICANWCCGGWRSAVPRLSAVTREANRIFAESLSTEDLRVQFRRHLLDFLWNRRDGAASLLTWLVQFRAALIDDQVAKCRTLDDEANTLTEFMRQLEQGNVAEGMTVAQFSGQGLGTDQINLSTLHSAKGREFAVVLLFGMDVGRLPRNGATQREIREARRLFYVGVTRAERELHIVYTAARPSPFVTEVMQRIEEEGN